MRNKRIANRIGLRGCSAILGPLRHGTFINAHQGLTCGAIQDIYPAGLAGLRNAFAWHAVLVDVEQDHRIRCIVVPDVVMHFLEVPAISAGLHIQRNDRGSKQVVAMAHIAVVIRAGIAGGEIQQTQLGIYCRCLPYGGAAVLPDRVVGTPGVVAKFTRAGDGVKSPLQRTVSGVEGFDSAAHAHFAAGKAGNHHAVVIERRCRDGETLLPLFSLDLPAHGTVFAIERQ